MLNRLAEEIASFCSRAPLEEKILVVPNRLIGHEVVGAIAASGQPLFNLRVETPRSLAETVAAGELGREGLRVLSRAEQMALVEDASDAAQSYFGTIRDRPGFHEAASLLLGELAEAGLDPAAVRIPGSGDKERDISAIGRAYQEGLRRFGLVDVPELLRRARQSARPGAAWVLVPRHPALRDDEMRLVETAAGDRLVSIETDDPGRGISLGASAGLLRVSDAEEEIRRVFRRLAAEGSTLDDAELVYADEGYRPLAFELSRELDLPCTFAEGVPVFFTHAGRAALGLLRWMERDFEGETLAALAESGDVEIRAAPAPFSGPEIARALRRAKVRWGRVAYARWLAADVPAAGISARSLSAVRDWAGSLVQEASSLDVRGRCSPSDLGAALFGMLPRAAAVRDDLDGAAEASLAQVLSEVAAISRRPRPFGEAAALVAEIVRTISIASQGPAPGRLHVAPVSSGGYSGRPRTFLVGLDAGTVPGRPREDPLLSDRERQAIRAAHGRSLPLRGDRSQERHEEIEAFLARLRGAVEISYPWRDAADGAEKFPSPFLLDLHRARTGRNGDGYDVLAKELSVDRSPGPALSEAEWWIGGIRRGEIDRAAAAEALASIRPLAATGLAAERARSGAAFTEFDGRVASARGRFDPRSGGAISPSSIETFASCPFRWFLREVLEVEPLETFERDDHEWLDPKTFGIAVHDLLRDFVSAVAAEGRRPAPADAGRLGALADSRLDGIRRALPPPTESAERLLRRRMARLCSTFLGLEARLPDGQMPRAFETQLGAGGERPTAFSTPQPVSVPLPSGKSFGLVGRIDRVDESSDGSFTVLDYKTGRMRKDAKRMGLDGGRKIQPALYATALEAHLGRRAAGGLYYHLGAGGAGFVPNLTEETRTELPGLLDSIFDAMSEGIFLHTRDSKRCPGCEFEPICGGPVASSRAAEKLGAERDPALDPLAALSGWTPKSGRR